MTEDQQGADPTDGGSAAAPTGQESVGIEALQPYHLRLVGGDFEIDRDGVIEGILTNTSAEDWGVQHRVGLHHFRDRSGRLIAGFEQRALLAPNQLRPGEQGFFRFDLKALAVPANAASFILDVVEEGVKWLAQDGGSAPVFRLRASGHATQDAWRALLAALRVDADSATAGKLSLIEQVLSRTPAGAVQETGRLRRLLEDQDRGKAYRPVRPDSVTIAGAIGGDRGSDNRAAFLRHFATVAGQPVVDGDVESYARIFDRFSRDAQGCFGTGGIPLPQDLCRWLGRRALPHAIAATPATRSMVATLGAAAPFDLNPDDNGAKDFWAYAHSVMAERNLAAAAMPDTALHAVTRAAARPRNGEFPPPTDFMQRLWQSDETYQAAYDLTSERDRLCLAIEICLAGLEVESMRLFLGANILAWLHQPLAGAESLSALELLVLALCGRAPPRGLQPERDSLALRREISWLAPDWTPEPDCTLRVLGIHHSTSGLGVNMRMSERVLGALNMPLALVDAEGDTVSRQDPRAEAAVIPSRPIDLFHLNLDEVPALICRYSRRDRPNTYRIGFALWETSAMPEQHRIGMELVDEIWAPTRYVADVYRAAGHPNVHIIGKGIELPEVEPFDLRTIGIDPGLTTFLVSFDLGSWVDRKNPVAAVEAFRQAFPRDPDVRLIIKSNGLFHHPGDRTNQVSRLEAAVEEDPRIVLLSDLLPFSKYLGLIGSVSATVSPHRAEGFGYFPAYSLLLGVPVIVTDHSGSTDFCTEETSFPVRAALHTLRPGEFVYDAPGAMWAGIDIGHLAERMRQVRNDRKDAIDRARRGQAVVRERYSMAAMADRYRNRLAAIR